MQTSPNQPAARTDYMSIAQLTVSGLGLIFSLLAALGLAIFGVLALMDGTDLASTTSLFSTAWISLFLAVLAVPSVLFSIQRLGGRAPALPQVRSLRLVSLLILVWPLVLLLGEIVSRQPRLAWLLLPPLQLLAVGIPVWWLVEIIRHKLPLKSRQRGWGLVNFSVFITTPLLMFVEVLFMAGLLILFALWVNSQPELLSLLERLAQRLVNAPAEPEAVLKIIQPYLQNPLLVFGILGIVAGLVPLIEELLKPLAVWAVAGNRLSPAEGFVAGGLCGAAFGMVESLFYLSTPLGEGWAALAVGRAGTALLHIATTAIIGWAMAYAWQKAAYLKLALAYLLAVILHGLWNALSILYGLGGTMNDAAAGPQALWGLLRMAPFGVAFLALLLFAMLWGINNYLQRQPAMLGEAPTTEPPTRLETEAYRTEIDQNF